MARVPTEKVNILTTWVVRGSLAFPIDMLRYDSAHPASEEDSNNIARSVASYGADHDALEVRVKMRGDPTLDRWKSFGWQVVGMIDRDGTLRRLAL